MSSLLSGRAVLHTFWLSDAVVNGRIPRPDVHRGQSWSHAVEGAAWEHPPGGSHLRIDFEIDQTFLLPLLASVETVVGNLGAS
jgi:hypothetical protein